MLLVLILDTQTHTKTRVRRMLEAASRAAGRAFDVPREQVRVLYEPGKASNYWEGETGDVPTQSRPVFVSVQTPHPVDRKKMGTMFAELSSAIAGALNILPERVWIRVDEADPELTAQGATPFSKTRRE
ncbi:MAG: hypothetical protein ACYTAF_13555 [Planctomycetota bacterium]